MSSLNVDLNKTSSPIKTKENSLNIFHQNVQGLKSKIRQIEIFASSNHIDVFCFSETFLKKFETLILQIEDYKMAAHFCRTHKSRGGVCIYIKKSLNCRGMQWVSDMSIELHFETCGILIPELNLVIVCVYRTPDSDLELFTKNLEILLGKLTTRSRYLKNKLVMAGDFNLNILKKDTKTAEFLSVFARFNLHPTIKEPTRLTAHSQTCIDNILTNTAQYTSSVINLGISDHTGQKITLPTSFSFNERYWYKQIRRIDFHMDIFKKYLAQSNFGSVLIEPDPNKAYNEFIDLFTMIFNLCVPLERVKIMHKKKPNWKSKGILKSSKTKRNMFLGLQRHKRDNIMKYKYKIYCKMLKKVIRLSNIILNDKTIKNSVNKPRATWKLIKENTSSTNMIPNLITRIDVKDKPLLNPLEIAEAFNEFFINQNAHSSIISDKFKNVSNGTSSSIFLAPVDSYEIKKIVRSLKNKKSSGFDNIPMTVIKSCIDLITEPLVHVINRTLETGIFPDQLKRALIKPLHKKGLKTDMANSRPIALLPSFSKIFEKVIFNRLTDFFNKNSTLSPLQFGFQKGKSTSLAIFEMFMRIWDNINEKRSCVSLLLDMSKAFDCVVHDIIFQQLEHIGVRGIALQLLKSYLCNREQAVIIESYDNLTKSIKYVQSSFSRVLLGVPQGSVLGPLLFLIYLNELPNLIPEPCVMFADDVTVLFSSDKRNIDLNHNIERSLGKIIRWLQTLNLKVNLSKTKLIQFRNYKTAPMLLNIKEAGTSVEEVTSASFLGVRIDTHLNWKSHIDQISKKISSNCYALSILSGSCSETVVVSAYYGNVYPLLTYGVIYWGNSVDVQKVFTLQKRCLRTVYRMRADVSLRDVFRNKRFLTLTGIYILELCLLIKCQSAYFTLKSSLKSNLRSQYKYNLQLPKVNNSIYKKSTYIMAIRVYNNLPAEIKVLEGILFKRRLKNWLIDKVFYSLNEFYVSQC